MVSGFNIAEPDTQNTHSLESTSFVKWKKNFLSQLINNCFQLFCALTSQLNDMLLKIASPIP